MSVTAVCSGCQKAFKAPDEYAGKKVKCKSCGTAFRVPALAGAGAPVAASGAAAARASTSSATAARVPKPRPAPVAADPYGDEERGEYDLSDDLGPVQPSPAMPPTAAASAAPTLAYAAPAVAPAAPAAMRAGATMYAPSGATTMAARHGRDAGSDGPNWLLIAQVAAFGLPVLLLMVGKVAEPVATAGILAGMFVGLAFILWGKIEIILSASQEGVGLLYLFVPFYPVYYILTHLDDILPSLVRMIAGLALIVGSVMMIPK